MNMSRLNRHPAFFTSHEASLTKHRKAFSMIQLDNKSRHPNFSTFFKWPEFYCIGILGCSFLCSSCVPSQGQLGPVKHIIQEMEPHQALSERAPFHLQGKHITDYLACVEATRNPFYHTNCYTHVIATF